jgi:hypothetical protein
MWAIVRLTRDLPTRHYDVTINEQPDLGRMVHVAHSRHCYTRIIQADADLVPGRTVDVELWHYQHRHRLDHAKARKLVVHSQTPSSERYRSAERRIGCF